MRDLRLCWRHTTVAQLLSRRCVVFHLGRRLVPLPLPPVYRRCVRYLHALAPLVRSVAFHGTLGLVGFIIYRLPGVYTRYDRRTGLGCGRCMLHRQLSLRIGRLDDSQAPMLGRYRSHVGVDVSRGR